MAQHQGPHCKIIMLEMPMKEIATRYPIFFFSLTKTSWPRTRALGLMNRDVIQDGFRMYSPLVLLDVKYREEVKKKN